MKTHILNVPFLCFNLTMIALELGNAGFHVTVYAAQAFLYIYAIKCDQDLKAVLARYPKFYTLTD